MPAAVDVVRLGLLLRPHDAAAVARVQGLQAGGDRFVPLVLKQHTDQVLARVLLFLFVPG